MLRPLQTVLSELSIPFMDLMLERGGVALPVSQFSDWVRRATKSGPRDLQEAISDPVYGWRRGPDGKVIVFRSTSRGEVPYAVEAGSTVRPWMLGGETGYELGRKARCEGVTFERRCYVPGGEYVYADLPAGSQADARRQRADFQVHFNRDPEEMYFRFDVVPNREVLRVLRDKYGDGLEAESGRSDVRAIVRAIERRGLPHPPVADAGWKVALAAGLLGIDLPYFSVVEPLDVVVEPHIPSLDGRTLR